MDQFNCTAESLEPPNIIINALQGDLHVIRPLTFAIVAIFIGFSTYQNGRGMLHTTLNALEVVLGGARHSVHLPGPPGLPIFGNLIEVSCYKCLLCILVLPQMQMQQGHVQKLAQWTEKYGDVFRLSLGEREAVSGRYLLTLLIGETVRTTTRHAGSGSF